ncbi:Hypothetical protein CINCED_3A018376 [Cinara cedri]|uniref:Uncharacterized protein n=1 Tax=Cinara cedri TaxID=506608 RepID=A0A5E4MKI3_9HEMI|nr:Hypothetical protein CINCED_3A018376 [Cinara cedri]
MENILISNETGSVSYGNKTSAPNEIEDDKREISVGSNVVDAKGNENRKFGFNEAVVVLVVLIKPLRINKSIVIARNLRNMSAGKFGIFWKPIH